MSAGVLDRRFRALGIGVVAVAAAPGSPSGRSIAGAGGMLAATVSASDTAAKVLGDRLPRVNHSFTSLRSAGVTGLAGPLPTTAGADPRRGGAAVVSAPPLSCMDESDPIHGCWTSI